MSSKRIEYEFTSSNGINTVRGVKYIPEDIKGVLVISHGMVEHYGRYENFMGYRTHLNEISHLLRPAPFSSSRSWVCIGGPRAGRGGKLNSKWLLEPLGFYS